MYFKGVQLSFGNYSINAELVELGGGRSAGVSDTSSKEGFYDGGC